MLERISAIIFNCREALEKLERLGGKLKVVSSEELENEDIKEIDLQTITIAERYIIFHDSVVKLEGMVKEVSSKKLAVRSEK